MLLSDPEQSLYNKQLLSKFSEVTIHPRHMKPNGYRMSRNRKIFIEFGYYNYTLQEISNRHGITKECIRQIIARWARKYSNLIRKESLSYGEDIVAVGFDCDEDSISIVNGLNDE
jgi:DNA-directed RNA polymerase sigma subunit (sigma70/sigma32)